MKLSLSIFYFVPKLEIIKEIFFEAFKCSLFDGCYFVNANGFAGGIAIF